MAHDVGVIHRDLKPANIQMTGNGVVKVLDFGIARATTPLLLAPSAETESGHSEANLKLPGAGTPPYMAPEQMLGIPTDQRGDLYILAVVLFELATGRRPYERVDPIELVQMPERRSRTRDSDRGSLASWE